MAGARHRLVGEEVEVVAAEQREHLADRELEAAEEEPVHPRVVVVEARHQPVVVEAALQDHYGRCLAEQRGGQPR